MAYVVKYTFADAEDKNHVYSAGDVYPRQGLHPTQERIDYLSSDKNRLHFPVIEKKGRGRKK